MIKYSKLINNQYFYFLFFLLIIEAATWSTSLGFASQIYYYAVERHWNLFWFWTIIDLILLLINVVTYLFIKIVEYKWYIDLSNKLRRSLSNKLVNGDYSIIKKTNFKSLYIYDASSYISGIQQTISTIVGALLMVLAVSINIIFLNPTLLTFVAFIVIGFYLYSYYGVKKSKKLKHDVYISRDVTTKKLSNSFKSYQRLYYINKTNLLYNFNQAELNLYNDAIKVESDFIAKKDSFNRLLVTLVIVLLNIISGLIIIKFSNSIGLFIAASSLLNTLIYEASRLSGSVNGLKSYSKIKDNLNKFLQYNNTPNSEKILGDILLENIEIKFNNKLIVTNINRQIKGENNKVLIEGKTGSGKSVLLKVITGLVRPSKGKVRWGDKQPVIDTIKNTISWTTNKATIVESATIKENITLFDPKIDELKMKSAIKLAKINFENNNIKTLSQGERQKIEIATALYQNKPIMLFDESFSSIDNKTRIEIINNLLTINNKLIIVSHHIDKNQRKGFDTIISL